MILLQNAEPSLQLLKALEDVATITKTLEEERLQHLQKVRQWLVQPQEGTYQGQVVGGRQLGRGPPGGLEV